MVRPGPFLERRVFDRAVPPATDTLYDQPYLPDRGAEDDPFMTIAIAASEVLPQFRPATTSDVVIDVGSLAAMGFAVGAEPHGSEVVGTEMSHTLVAARFADAHECLMEMSSGTGTSKSLSKRPFKQLDRS
jgi:hypothetical protein